MAIAEIIAAVEGVIIAIGIIRETKKRRRKTKEPIIRYPKEVVWNYSKTYDTEKAAIDYHRNMN